MKFILDLSKWRSGCGNSALMSPVDPVGKGRTALLNPEGFQCCLGQFCAQLGVPDAHLRDESMPDDLGSQHAHLLDHLFIDGGSGDSMLAQRAAEINDDTTMTAEDRVFRLKELFGAYGHSIEVVGEPVRETNHNQPKE